MELEPWLKMMDARRPLLLSKDRIAQLVIQRFGQRKLRKPLGLVEDAAQQRITLLVGSLNAFDTIAKFNVPHQCIMRGMVVPWDAPSILWLKDQICGPARVHVMLPDEYPLNK